MNELITILVALLGLIGAFAIFRLQWLRREIDDYRGRVMGLIKKSNELLPVSDLKFQQFCDCNYKQDINNCSILWNDGTSATLNYELFKKRFAMKNKVLNYVGIYVWGITLLLIAYALYKADLFNSITIIGNKLNFSLSIVQITVFVLVVFIILGIWKLLELLKNDY